MEWVLINLRNKIPIITFLCLFCPIDCVLFSIQTCHLHHTHLTSPAKLKGAQVRLTAISSRTQIGRVNLCSLTYDRGSSDMSKQGGEQKTPHLSQPTGSRIWIVLRSICHHLLI